MSARAGRLRDRNECARPGRIARTRGRGSTREGVTAEPRAAATGGHWPGLTALGGGLVVVLAGELLLRVLRLRCKVNVLPGHGHLGVGGLGDSEQTTPATSAAGGGRYPT